MQFPIRLALLLGLSLTATACGAPQGPHVRFADATQSQIEAAQQSGDVVWYDFEAGDEVPMIMGLVGVSAAVTEQPTRWIARRAFSVVVFPDGRTLFSFDGRRLVPGEIAVRWNLALGAGPEGGRAALLLFIGEEQDVPVELR